MANQRQYPRTPLKCRIKICHPSFGELIAQTRDLSDGGVYIKHADLLALPPGTLVSGQVQDLPIAAPILQMRVMRADGEGVGLRFCAEDDERQAAE
ncbi:PilZ domain-containing protein [Pseudomonas cavernae]|uniref:PilZ domain-containing protein n=1 Tax=Pseudomonas cavernae TaxID=2320867 RepID=A0A385YZ69_9PSED|nr:PilZ domain-containing protein [Pseudomonas cavernae]AYC30873.1 PilZ domain-containing protein [Pseudomonas cavernae]